MLSQAREHFPQGRYPGLRYKKMGLQEMDFQAEFDSRIAIAQYKICCRINYYPNLRRNNK
jgi:hypothetical protein